MNPVPAPEKKIWQITSGITITGLEWKNEKPVALLAHANGFCAETWTQVARILFPHYHVIAFDTRGHGSSSKPAPPEGYHWQHMVDDLLEISQQILVETGQKKIALLAGNSLGGVIAACTAAEQDCFERVVMLDPPLRPSEAMIEKMKLKWPKTMPNPGNTIADIARRRKSIWPSREVAAKAWRKKPVFAKWDNESYELYIKYGMQDRADGDVELSCPPAVEASIFESTGSIDIFERAGNVACPVQLVHASGGLFPIQIYQVLVQLFPHGALYELPGGHLLPMVEHEVTAAFLIEPDPKYLINF